MVYEWCKKPPRETPEAFATRVFPLSIRKKRADERTRTADLLITSDNSGVAEVCRSLQIPHR